MERDTKVLVLALAVGLLLPTAPIALMVATGSDAIDIIIQAVLLFSLLPLLGVSIYMWATGKGASLIAGYNTSPRAVREQYDTDKLARFVGKLMFFIMVPMTLAMESIFLLDFEWPFFTLLAISLAIIVVGLVYMNTGGRFLKEGAVDPKLLITEEDKKKNRQMLYGLLALMIIIGVALAIIFLFVVPGGDVTAELLDEGLKVDAPMVSELIPYEDIESIELREDLETGRRVAGFAGDNIRSGNYRNEEFGRYTLASYNAVPMYIVVYHSGEVLAFNLETVESTQEVYDQLRAMT
ncbi:hypothetical protein AOA80_03255 [Methanomassiliicoccales archaeon RumEn M1]|jgi:hypothetical protein|nr:hypothetical protein AOA80_03255 [Methanomassiliicoccales archaeon RumEn M1]